MCFIIIAEIVFIICILAEFEVKIKKINEEITNLKEKIELIEEKVEN